MDRLGHYRMESTGIRGTKTVPVPGTGEPNIQGTRTERFRYPSVYITVRGLARGRMLITEFCTA